jgi:CheY-specific phosphatase CheX
MGSTMKNFSLTRAFKHITVASKSFDQFKTLITGTMKEKLKLKYVLILITQPVTVQHQMSATKNKTNRIAQNLKDDTANCTTKISIQNQELRC